MPRRLDYPWPVIRFTAHAINLHLLILSAVTEAPDP